jgi:integrase/recombinase XerD
VTILLQRMREELVRRTYSETTIRSYLHAVEAFRQHVQKRLDHLGPDDLRRYQVYLLEDRKLANGTVVIQISALRFFYIKVLRRRDMKEDLPYPKRLKQLPVVLSQEEVSLLINCARNLFHRAMLLTMYAAGLRRSELCRLKVSNIDSQRMMLRIERSKNAGRFIVRSWSSHETRHAPLWNGSKFDTLALGNRDDSPLSLFPESRMLKSHERLHKKVTHM